MSSEVNEVNPYAAPKDNGKDEPAKHSDSDGYTARIHASQSPASGRGLLVLGLLVAATVADRFAYSFMRLLLVFELPRDMSSTSIAPVNEAMQWLQMAGMVLGGVAALAIGSRITAAGGALIAMVGHFVLASAPLLTATSLVAFGSGVLRPCLFAAAAQVLTSADGTEARPNPLRFAGMTAFAFALSGAIVVGVGLPQLALYVMRISYWGGRALSAGVNGSVALLGVILTGIAVVLGRRSPRAPAQGPVGAGSYRRLHFAPLLGLAILAVATVTMSIGDVFTQPPRELVRAPAGSMWLLMINPGAIGITSIALCGLAIVAVRNRWVLPPLALYAAGLTVFGAGLVVIAVAVAGDAGEHVTMPFAVGALIAGVGEAAMSGSATAYVALAVPGRVAALAVAAWYTVMTGVTSIAALLGVFDTWMPLVLIIAVICLGGGGVILAFARRMHRVFFDPPQGMPEATQAPPSGA